jgi:adenine-specific DNA-methyltransferase
VVNFLNQRNAADQRVFQLLSEKLRLFDGVFGASDEVLGALESGVDIERRIAQVYQTCRSSAEIDAAFDALQLELEEQIRDRMAQTRQSVLEHFDEEVHQRLRIHQDQAMAALDQRGRWLAELTRAELGAEARWEPGQPRFYYAGEAAPRGWYHLDWKEADRRGDSFYRVDHALAALLIDRARGRALPTAAVDLDHSGHGVKVALLEPLRGRQGWLCLSLLTVQSLEEEEHLLLAGRLDDGQTLEAELCARLLGLRATLSPLPAAPAPDLGPEVEAERQRCLRRVEEREARHFDEEVQKLGRWSEDLKVGLERHIRDLDREITLAQRRAVLAQSLAEKLDAQRQLRELQQQRTRRRRDLFEEQDRIDEERSALIAGIERQLATSHRITPLYTLRWALR